MGDAGIGHLKPLRRGLDFISEGIVSKMYSGDTGGNEDVSKEVGSPALMPVATHAVKSIMGFCSEYFRGPNATETTVIDSILNALTEDLRMMQTAMAVRRE